MDLKCTPGEWQVKELRRGNYDQPRESWEIVPTVFADCGLENGNGSNAIICEVPAGGSAFCGGESVNRSHTVTLEEARANAALMAAAPRLARALCVIALDPRICAFLTANDPKALEQVRTALVAAGTPP